MYIIKLHRKIQQNCGIYFYKKHMINYVWNIFEKNKENINKRHAFVKEICLKY